MKQFYILAFALFISSLGFGQIVIYDADYTSDGDGFAGHTTASPPAAGPASAGPFGNAPNSWSLSYVNTPGTDGSSNTFEVIGGELQSDDWGGQGIFMSQVIDVSSISVVNISASTVNSGANDNEFIYFYILDGGSRVETANISSSNGNSVNYNITELDVTGINDLVVGFEFQENGSGDGYDTSEFTVTTPSASCTAPTTQASAYNTTSIGTTSATLNWTSGNGQEVLVVIKEGTAVDTTPTSGTAYTANTVFTSGDQIGTGNYVVQSGSSTSSVSITGLSPATTYHVAVYEYNTTDVCYNLTELTGNFTTDCSTPLDVTAFTATSGNTAVDLSWTNGSCFDDILVVAKATSAVTVTPTGDGSAYTANAAFGSGTNLGSSEFAVYKGSGTAVTVTGLTNGTTYHFKVYARKGTTWSSGVSDSDTPNAVEEAVAGDLIITEVSGDASAAGNDNGYMEIYNRSNKTINLDNIEARYYNTNPNSPSDTVSLSGTLSPGGYLIVTQNGGAYTTEYSDTADATGTNFFFNGGDDGCDVFHTTNGVLDQFNDNGSGQSPWDWNDTFTYKRNSSDSGAIEDNWTLDGTNNTPRTKTNLYFWTGSSDSSWATAGNWDEGSAPSSITDVVITDQTNKPSISSTVEVSNFTIETSSDVIVEKTGNIDIAGNLNNNGNLTLESDSNEYSSLIVDGTVTGTINYNRYTAQVGPTGTNDLISAPLSGQTFGNFANANTNLNTSGTTAAFAPFNNSLTPSANYVNLNTVSDASVVLNAGDGYRAATSNGSALTFTGTVNTSTISKPITVGTGTNGKWNLIGNPYPSYIDLATFFSANNTQFDTGAYQAVYGYDGDASNGWTIWNQLTIDDANTTELISPGQGFFVASKTGGGSVTFTPAMRTNGSSDDFIAGRSSASNLVLAKLNMVLNSNNYHTDIYFTDNATANLDPGYDAGAFGDTTKGLYSYLIEGNTGVELAIQALPYNNLNNTIVPLGINVNAGDELNISLDESSSIPLGTNVYLEDALTNTLTLINSTAFVLNPSEALNGIGRFLLRFTSSTLNTSSFDVSNLQIFSNLNEKTIIVKGILSEDSKLSIYDIHGRVVLNTILNSTATYNSIAVDSLNTGIYIIQVNNATQNKTQKVIIN